MPIATVINILTKVALGASVVGALTYGGVMIYNIGYADGHIDTVSEAMDMVDQMHEAETEPANG